MRPIVAACSVAVVGSAAGATAILLAILVLGTGIGADIQKSKAAGDALLSPVTVAPKSAVPNAPKVSTATRDALFRADVARLEREYAIRAPRGSRFECAVVRQERRR